MLNTRTNPWTYGPDGAGRMMAAGQCVVCGAQCSGPWTGGEDRDAARDSAVDALHDQGHVCAPAGTGVLGPAILAIAK